MATATGYTKARMDEIVADTIVGAHIDGSGHLILEKFDTTTIDAGYMIASVPDASTTVKGIVELATSAETIAGTDAVRAVTPEGLAAKVASDTAAGVVELATNAETLAGTDATRAVTPASLKAAVSALAMTGEIRMWGGIVAPDGWYFADGASRSRTTDAPLFDVVVPSLGTATMTIASPCVVTRVAHGLIAGDPIIFTTTGALPTGVSANTIYYVISTGLGLDTFRFSATFGGAAVNSSGSQSGTHTLRRAPFGIPSSTSFYVPNFNGRSPMGPGNSGANGATTHPLGHVTGEEAHTLTAAEMPSHRHNVQADASGGWAAGNWNSTVAGAVGWQGGTGSDRSGGGYYTSTLLELTGGGGAHNVLHPVTGVNFIIKR